ncbi:ESX secretion-associated protein EspG [Mycobacterium sp. MS1601]|uniref:ESX secretion-associated protein EspG n=1 Tax=Mycobacterium sp. MS1601 TaxID=1936029 RepID=UPI0009795B98|nr:ESX secretion-associated protein EspG [Mycobacterium sp. MS1601]AQA03632.1 ESX secretion-associated protein EspG [Mycobacterium sp. MS1601]
MRAANAVELTVDGAWYIADAVGAGTLPWVLGITTPYQDAGQRAGFVDGQIQELTSLGVICGGRISPAVEEWFRVVCFPQRWLELRYVRGASGELLRGIVARRGEHTVVALRNAQLVTLSALSVDDPYALVPILAVGLGNRDAARFEEFSLPARVGARADAQLRDGADLAGVLDYLGVPDSARHVVEAVFRGPRSYVEIVAGQRGDGTHSTTKVGIALVDTEEGRLVVSPAKAADGEWVSTFAPGTSFAIAMAIDNLTATLPDGQWFPATHLARDFTARRA